MATQSDADERTRSASAEESERRLTAEYVTARALVESATLSEAIPKILQAICEALGWEHGAFWEIDPKERVLRCMESWHTPRVAFPAFDVISHQVTFAPGIGMPGRVWATGEAAWIPDVTKDDNFPRAAAAAREGRRARRDGVLQPRDP
jgi:hypothetical protein